MIDIVCRLLDFGALIAHLNVLGVSRLRSKTERRVQEQSYLSSNVCCILLVLEVASNSCTALARERYCYSVAS